jgi:type I restriction enzyme M protein
MNGSPLFTGDAGSGETEIRRWILENDWLDAIVALPEQLFYNTGIATYVWILTNRKLAERKGKVQLIDATSMWIPMRKSLGNKRREISSEQIKEVTRIYNEFEESEQSKIYRATYFGYRKIVVERPLRLNFYASPERIERLKDEKAFQSLAVSKKKDLQAKAREEEVGKREQEKILGMLTTMPDTLFKDRPSFEMALSIALKRFGLKLPAPLNKAILSALSERDESAEICRDKDGYHEPDPELRDTESVPLNEDITDYFDREVKPHVPDAWINTSIRDHKDGEVGRVGYEISFNRYFYKYTPPRSLEEIESEIRTLEKEIAEMLMERA